MAFGNPIKGRVHFPIPNPLRALNYVDYVLGFDGTNDISFSSIFSNKVYDVTFAFWFKTTDTSKWGEENIFYNGLHGTDGYGLYVGGNPSPRDVRFAVLANGKWWNWFPITWNVDERQHVTIQFIYETATTITLKLYLNAVLQWTRTGRATPIVPTTQALLGNNGGAPPDRDLGRNSAPAISTWLDDFRIWNRVLTVDEIEYDMFHKRPSFDDLVLWVPMDEGEGNTIYDKSGQNNNGIITGASWVKK